MSDTSVTEAAPAPELPADTPPTFASVSEAARFLSKSRGPKETAESAPSATAEPELAQEANAAAEETQPTGETQEAAPAETPPRELPRSWTKDRTEHWNKLDPDTQDFLLEQDRKASAEVRRVQNEAAEKSKAIEAKVKEAEQARQQYEAKLASTVKNMQDVLQAEFGDIQTMQDVRKLQAEDPFRFQAWQVRQMELTAAKAEESAIEQRQAQEKQGKRSSYEAEQNALLIGLVPEMADPKKASELRERAIEMLTDPDDLGLKTETLTRWMADDTGHEILSNAGIQKLIADGLKYRDIKSASKAVSAKPVPPVQRPGTPAARNASGAQKIQDLQKRVSNASGLEAIRLGAELLRAQRSA